MTPGSSTKKVATPSNITQQVMAAIYWDLNFASQLQQICAGENPGKEEQQEYERILHQAYAIVWKLLGKSKIDEYVATKQFIQKAGWDIFGICAFSTAFHDSYKLRPVSSVLDILDCITSNSLSLRTYANSRGLEWRAPLNILVQSDVDGLEGLDDALDPRIDISQEHPHHTVQTLSGTLKRPIYRNRAQVTIGSNIFNSIDFQDKPSYPFTHPPYGKSISCMVCGSRKVCECKVDVFTGDLVELVEFPGRGTGVRALCSIKKDDCVGIYIGDVAPGNHRQTYIGDDDVFQDVIYPLSQVNPNSSHETMGFIYSPYRGNWTRYINHSCDSSLQFSVRADGDEAITTVIAIKDINIFDELTVNYGRNYWSGSKEGMCRCGTKRCITNFPNRSWVY